MKLAEALLERKNAKQKIEALQARLEENVLVQEGDQPAESPHALMIELNDTIARTTQLICDINAANNAAALPDGTSISEAVVRRDMLQLQRQALERVVAAASMRNMRFGRSEVRFVHALPPSEIRRDMDRISQQWRELDAQIQAANWQVELPNGS